ncbi:MAG: purine/pyrimidine phosphoribosyl transferase signature-containing protein [Gammaproteobacteria bacterium]|nr:purine/pyrimidine phosphoribosyl transferase signature-containing protein [Gammaproteobacteria bacterium]
MIAAVTDGRPRVDRITTTNCNEPGTGSSGLPFRPAIRSVLFCSCYIYSPHGGGIGSASARLLCLRLKSSDAGWLPSVVREVYEQVLRNGAFDGLFANEAVLVPVPGSAPSAGAPWAAERLAVALHGIGLGKSVWEGVRRRVAVRKSATANNAERPTVKQHYESFAAVRPALAPERIVLVDDVITKGRTIFAAATRLHEALPNADIRAFALIRTMGFLPDVAQPLEPCQGFVTWSGGDARRNP